MKKAVVLSIFLTVILLAINSFAATYTSVVGGLNWTNPAMWTGGPIGGVPGFGDIVIIKHQNVALNGGSYTSWSTGTSITIQNNGSLNVAGNIDFTGSGVNFIITSGSFNVTGNLTITSSSTAAALNGGNLNVSGTLTMNNGSRMNLNSGTSTLSVGSLTIPDFQSSAGVTYTAGTLAVSNNLSVGSGATFSYPSTLSIPGSVTIKNGAAITASSVGGSTIDLQGGSKLTLTGGTVAPTSLNISNGELIVAGATVSYTNNVTLNGSSTLRVNSGSFATSQKLTVNSGTFVSASAGTASFGSLDVTNSGGTTFTNGGTVNVGGSVDQGGTITNQAGATMNVTANYIANGSGTSVTDNYGAMNIGGNMSFPSAAKYRIYPGGKTIVNGSVTTSSNQNLVIGTNVVPAAYADMVIKGNLMSTGSGDVLVDRNGRLALYGNFTSDGGGNSNFVVNNGGKVFINGTTTFNGGGDHLTNNTTSSPYGVYSNSQPVYNGSGTSNGAAGASSVTSVATMQSQDPDFYLWAASQPNSPLPVELAYFKLQKTGESSISLIWQSTVEKNFDFFQIERAGEDFNFIAIGKIKGKGGMNIKTDYAFDDNAPLDGNNYYRLKSIDLDGNYKYSSLVRASWTNKNNGVTLYPNPVIDHTFKLNVDDNFDSNVTVSVLESRGYVVYSAKLIGSSTEVALPQDLAAGVYYVRVASPSQQQTIRVIVN